MIANKMQEVDEKMQTQHEDVLHSLQVMQKQSVHVQNLLETELRQSLSGCRIQDFSRHIQQAVCLSEEEDSIAMDDMTAELLQSGLQLESDFQKACGHVAGLEFLEIVGVIPEEQNLQPETACR